MVETRAGDHAPAIGTGTQGVAGVLLAMRTPVQLAAGKLRPVVAGQVTTAIRLVDPRDAVAVAGCSPLG